jgi:hypothetical protein
MELKSASTAPALTVEEMASTLLDIADADEVALRRAASVELAAFQEYASTYAVFGPVFVCKGCHGG